MNLKWLPALVLATQLHAATIDLGEDRRSALEGFTFSDLNGPTPSRQLSFDLFFNNSVHVFSNTLNFSLGLEFLCSPTNFLTGSASLLDASGQTTLSCETGSFITSDGFMVIGFYPFTNESYDFYGVHFDLNIPATTIFQGEFFLSGQNKLFRIGTNVPESGMTITLLVMALIILLAFYDQKTTR